jgi:hypothetical protein
MLPTLAEEEPRVMLALLPLPDPDWRAFLASSAAIAASGAIGAEVDWACSHIFMPEVFFFQKIGAEVDWACSHIFMPGSGKWKFQAYEF